MSNQEYKSEQITFTLSRQADCMVEYTVSATPELVQKARKQAIRAIAKEASIPGFRKGKAPDSMIVKKYPNPVAEKWKTETANIAFRECQKVHFVPLLDQETKISFNVEKQSLEEGATIKLSFETEPEMPTIDTSAIELSKVPEEKVDQKKIDEKIHQIQHFFATMEPAGNRAAKEGDFVIIDIDIIEEDPPKKAITKGRFELSRSKMAKWMTDLLIGMQPGESKEGVSQPDESASEEEKKEHPPKKVKVTLLDLEVQKLPPIDDALATKVGTKNTQEMKDNIKVLLEKQAKEALQAAYREQINTHLLETYHFDLPKSLLQKETQFRIKQLAEDKSFQEKLMKMNEEERKKIIQEIEDQGRKALKLFYLSRKIIQDQKISISPSDVHQEVKTPLDALFSKQSDHYGPKENSQEQNAIAMSRLILTKAEDFLISQAKIALKSAKKIELKKEKETKKVAPKKRAAAPKKKATSKKKNPPNE